MRMQRLCHVQIRSGPHIAGRRCAMVGERVECSEKKKSFTLQPQLSGAQAPSAADSGSDWLQLLAQHQRVQQLEA